MKDSAQRDSTPGDSTPGDSDSEAAPTRARSTRGARTNVSRPGLAQSALHRMRGVNPRHAVIMAIVLAFVILTLAMPLRTYFSQQSEFDQLRDSNAQLRREVAEYQQKVNEQGDPAYTEAKARARLQYARPGETVLILTFPGQAERKAEEDRAAAKARNPWYGNLWDSVATPATGK
ncbi:septum formation initiator family protein [Gordonia sp. TBRC 11910]|uniref:Septum formation initiator family protein n=1 Tax=Gordonia asplenii TaxID=2725283 RepID=A0A848L5Q4_9ACTN|nr:septum formation initiator family protein [Gordonia asplenii]NMO03983.1 septum formation initiator family protein [Gordonia asplenii]